MEASALLDAHVQLKRIYTSMNEAMDITQQLAEAVDRGGGPQAAVLCKGYPAAVGKGDFHSMFISSLRTARRG